MADTEQKDERREIFFSKEDAGKYSVGNLCYPEDISSREDLLHYVSFFINVRQSSKFNPDNRIGFVTNGNQGRLDFDSTAAKVAVGAVAAGTTGALVGKYMVGALGKQASSMIKKKAAAIGGAAGALGAGGLAAVGGVGASGTIFHTEKTQRISDVITLAVQNSPSASYSAGWETAEIGSILGGLAGGQSAVDASAHFGNISSDLTRRMAETMASAPTALFGTNQVRSFIEASTKRVVNPQKEQLFKSIGFRSFEFQYTFMPRSYKEVLNIQNIIKTFKMHMHPELSASGIYYIYPAEFDIQYYYKGQENIYLSKISSCALTDLTVTYGGEQFSTFPDGSPTVYKLNLKFTELETLTKERIDKGY